MARDLVTNEVCSILGIDRKTLKSWVAKGWIEEHGFNGAGQPFFWSDNISQIHDKMEFCRSLSLDLSLWPRVDVSNKKIIEEVRDRVAALLLTVLKCHDKRQSLLEGKYSGVLPSTEA